MPGALDDITVLDLGQVIAMPICTMLLADMGARVIKIESRERGAERMSLGIRRKRDGKTERVHAAQYRDRNKLGITLDLKHPEGVALFKELCRKADVVCENFSVGAMARLGLGYEVIKEVNPRIVYASITAFGQNGPYAEQRGYDMLSQAISGFMSINGFPENPPTRGGASLSDYYSGMLTAFSIVSALRYRDRTGQGQYIDIALLDSILMCLDNLGERYTVGGEVLTRAGNVAFGGSASGVYRACDGYVAIAAATSDAVWRRFCKLAARPELANDPDYATVPARRDRRDAVVRVIQDWTSKHPKAYVVKALAEAGVPAAPVNTIDETVADPQVRAREMFVERVHPQYGPLIITGTPLKLSATPGRIERLAPLAGEHNDEVFVRLLGHSNEELARWIRDGVI
jgi:formyl-CoA transferase